MSGPYCGRIPGIYSIEVTFLETTATRRLSSNLFKSFHNRVAYWLAAPVGPEAHSGTVPIGLKFEEFDMSNVEDDVLSPLLAQTEADENDNFVDFSEFLCI